MKDKERIAELEKQLHHAHSQRSAGEGRAAAAALRDHHARTNAAENALIAIREAAVAAGDNGTVPADTLMTLTSILDPQKQTQ